MGSFSTSPNAQLWKISMSSGSVTFNVDLWFGKQHVVIALRVFADGHVKVLAHLPARAARCAG
jgi:hypothetical protein